MARKKNYKTWRNCIGYTDLKDVAQPCPTNASIRCKSLNKSQRCKSCNGTHNVLRHHKKVQSEKTLKNRNGKGSRKQESGLTSPPDYLPDSPSFSVNPRWKIKNGCKEEL
jgi:hypothetical protein